MIQRHSTLACYVLKSLTDSCDNLHLFEVFPAVLTALAAFIKVIINHLKYDSKYRVSIYLLHI